MSEDKEGALCREHVDLHTCEFSDVLTPDTAGIDCDRCVALFGLLCDVVVDLDTLHCVAVLDEACHFAVHLYSGSVEFGVDNVCRSKSEWIHCSVRNLYCSDDVRVSGRLHSQSLLRVDDIRSDACLKTGFHKLCLICKIIFRKCKEQTLCLLHAMSCNFAENHVLLDTLFC